MRGIERERGGDGDDGGMWEVGGVSGLELS